MLAAQDPISVLEAYRAMLFFLDQYYQATGSDDGAGLLGSMNLAGDGEPMDRAMWDDWISAIQRARAS